MAASDTKLTTGHYSVESEALKIESFHPDWQMMLSGRIGDRANVVQYLRDNLDREVGYTAEDVAQVCTKGYVRYQRQISTEKVLSAYNLDIDSLMDSRERLGDALFERLVGDISRVQVGFEMLVLGFDPAWGYQPRLFVVSNPNEDHPSFVAHYDDTCFAAIGAGAYMADSYLYSLSQFMGCSLPETIYNVCCAKFAAESASDVGEMSYVRVIQRDKTIRLDTAFVDRDLRAEWSNYGRPRMRKDIINSIEKGISAAKVFSVRPPIPETSTGRQ